MYSYYKQDDINPLNRTRVIDFLRQYKIGSILNTPFGKAQSAKVWQQVQKIIQEEAKNNAVIPVIFGIDSKTYGIILLIFDYAIKVHVYLFDVKIG